LSERKIAAEDGPTRVGKFLGQRHQKRRIAIAASSVCQNETVAGRFRGAVQETPDGWGAVAIGKSLNFGWHVWYLYAQ
jgi:hypothetical protein